MSHSNTASCDIAHRLLAKTANSQPNSVDCPQFAIDEMHSAVGSNIEEVRSRLEEAKRKKINASENAAENSSAVKTELENMARQGARLLDMMKSDGYNFPKMFGPNYETQASGTTPNNHEALLEQIRRQGQQIEMLERMQKTDAEQLKALRAESAQYREDVDMVFEERELQLSHAYSENIALEKEKKQLQTEVSELKAKCKNIAKENLERQGSLFTRVRELETELLVSQQSLKVKTLEFDALAGEHKSVNKLLLATKGKTPRRRNGTKA